MDVFTTINNLSITNDHDILEIGPGETPLGLEINLGNSRYETVDIATIKTISTNHIHYTVDFLQFETIKKYDLIVDRCCLHEQAPKKRLDYLNKIHFLLKDNGKYFCEHAVNHKNLSFKEDNLLFDNETNCLIEQENNQISICKYIPSALEIEQELKSSKFKINSFYCHPGKKIICNRKDPTPRNHDPDHLFFIVQKN